MKKSNVRVRSNVFVRADVPLEQDVLFLAQVRGTSAIGKVLDKLKPGQRHEMAGRQLLTPKQLSEVAWQVRCVCGAFPEGPISRGAGVEIQFRCPQNNCKPSSYRARTVYLDRYIVDVLTQRFQKTLSKIVADALSIGEQSIQAQSSREKFPFPVRLTLSQYTLVSDSEIEKALYATLERKT